MKFLDKEGKKVVSINLLLIITVLIMFLGLFYVAFSIRNDISIRILNSSIHGAVFGLLVLYLGTRYYLLVQKLKPEIYKSTSEFSWSNFRKKKAVK